MAIKPLYSMRCVVLGGGGFIGTNLCRRLAGRVSALRAFGRRQSFPKALEGIDWFQGDFNDPSSIAAAIEGYDTVFHLISATTPAIANVDKIADLRSNVASTLHLLEACRAEGVDRVIFVSSGGTIYGIPQQFPTNEDAPCWPISAYGVSKLAIERYLYLFDYLHKLDYRVLRVSNPFGPYQFATKNQGVIAAFLKCAIAGQSLQVWGDGTVSRDYLYVDDVSQALELAAIHEGPDRIFNVGSGVARSLNEVIEAIRMITNVRLKVEYRKARLVDVPATALDITRAHFGLSWSPETDFTEGLRRTLAWMSDGALR
jgi:UDP-glucose 4-epimerase